MPTSSPTPGTRPLAPLVLALGSFDGVHLGHRQILARAQTLAAEMDGVAGVLTYDPLPAQLIYPDFTYVLTPLTEKCRLLTELGIGQIRVIRFDRAVQQTEPEDFVRQHVVSEPAPAAVVIGHDHRFGCKGRGDAQLLARLLEPRHIRLEVVPEYTLLGGPVRSTRIREALLLGHVKLAADLLGRYYSLSGTIVPGTGTGRRLGFPTVNLRPIERESLVPADGVYVARADLLGRRFDAVLNIGHRPTFGGETRTIEAHLLDLQHDIQPPGATFHIIDRLRPERRFASAEALSTQIAADVAQAHALLCRLPPLPNLDMDSKSNNL